MGDKAHSKIPDFAPGFFLAGSNTSHTFPQFDITIGKKLLFISWNVIFVDQGLAPVISCHPPAGIERYCVEVFLKSQLPLLDIGEWVLFLFLKEPFDFFVLLKQFE